MNVLLLVFFALLACFILPFLDVLKSSIKKERELTVKDYIIAFIIVLLVIAALIYQYHQVDFPD